MTVIKIELDEDDQLSASGNLRMFTWAKSLARRLPNGYIKKITWDADGGYPEHAWGYVQYSPRPFRQGYGCDGTTDDNIHLIATVLCARLGLDYISLYKQAYPGDDDVECWITGLLANNEIHQETIIPEHTGCDELILMLSDLYQINNRSLVSVLEESLMDKELDVRGWYLEEERLRTWKEG